MVDRAPLPRLLVAACGLFVLARNDVALFRQVRAACRDDREDMGPFFHFGAALEALLGH